MYEGHFWIFERTCWKRPCWGRSVWQKGILGEYLHMQLWWYWVWELMTSGQLGVKHWDNFYVVRYAEFYSNTSVKVIHICYLWSLRTAATQCHCTVVSWWDLWIHVCPSDHQPNRREPSPENSCSSERQLFLS